MEYNLKPSVHSNFAPGALVRHAEDEEGKRDKIQHFSTLQPHISKEISTDKAL
jgi:hypothetical protein